LEVVSNINEQIGGNNFTDTSIDLPDELEVVSITNEQFGGNNFSDTSIDLPDDLEVVSMINNQEGGNIISETSIDLPDELEVVSISNQQIGGDCGGEHDDYNKENCGDDDEKKLLGGDIENIFLKNFQSTKDYTSNLETSIDLPQNLEIDTINDDIISESTSLNLPYEIEVTSKA